MVPAMTEYRNVHGHVEVYVDGKFVLSADTKGEAIREMEKEQVKNK